MSDRNDDIGKSSPTKKFNKERSNVSPYRTRRSSRSNSRNLEEAIEAATSAASSDQVPCSTPLLRQAISSPPLYPPTVAPQQPTASSSRDPTWPTNAIEVSPSTSTQSGASSKGNTASKPAIGSPKKRERISRPPVEERVRLSSSDEGFTEESPDGRRSSEETPDEVLQVEVEERDEGHSSDTEPNAGNIRGRRVCAELKHKNEEVCRKQPSFISYFYKASNL